MYLNVFSEQQRKVFLNLAYTLICSDNIVTDDEKSKIESYSQELGYAVDIQKLSVVNIDNAIEEMGPLSDVTKRKLYFELMGLAQADFDYDVEEQQFMNKVQAKLRLEDKVTGRIKKTVVKLLEAQIEMKSIFREG